jgi:predicted nucleotidyltransferase
MVDDLQEIVKVLTEIRRDLEDFHPRAVLLFGSLARALAGLGGAQKPKDIDLLVVGDDTPATLEAKDYGYPTQIMRMRIYTITEIARSLRYDSRPLALSKLYGNQLIKRQASHIIAACLLLGPAYRSFGIEQIELDGRADQRDYSVHKVLLGEAWWRQIITYTRERRGPLKRFSDKIVQRDIFDAH